MERAETMGCSVEPEQLEEVAEGFLVLFRAPGQAVHLVESSSSFLPRIPVLLAGCILIAVATYVAMWASLGPRVPEVRAMTTKAEPVVEPEMVPLREISPRAVSGLLKFRGNSTLTFYGEGPVTQKPRLLWRFPDRPMCSESSVAGTSKIWCGTGWTGQPVVWERADGVTEVIVGAFDRAVHFVNLETGRRTRPDFVTGDIIKGSVTLDPDGDPLLYFGSRDDKLRILALDRNRPTELWNLNANLVPGMWNNDWDSSPLVINDILYEGGENGYLFAFRLHRDYDMYGKVRVKPELLLAIRGWTDELIGKVGDRNVSIENSVSAFGDRLYFANSAGRVVGIDISEVHSGRAPVVFEFWMGDDVDASIVVDEYGMLYVAAELERYLPRSDEIGQLVKLDPYNQADPVVWKLGVPPSLTDWRGGIWSTPALGADVLYMITHSGTLAVVDRENGKILFTDDLGPHAWSSPALVGEHLVVATCQGEIRSYDVTDPAEPRLEWTVEIPTRACIESTPAIWRGRIVVGARDGYLYAFGD